MDRLRQNIGDPNRAHMVCFNSSILERTLAVQLTIPLYANDPSNQDLGSKSGCREIFRDAEFVTQMDLKANSAAEITEALSELKGRNLPCDAPSSNSMKALW